MKLSGSMHVNDSSNGLPEKSCISCFEGLNVLINLLKIDCKNICYMQ